MQSLLNTTIKDARYYVTKLKRNISYLLGELRRADKSVQHITGANNILINVSKSVHKRACSKSTANEIFQQIMEDEWDFNRFKPLSLVFQPEKIHTWIQFSENSVNVDEWNADIPDEIIHFKLFIPQFFKINGHNKKWDRSLISNHKPKPKGNRFGNEMCTCVKWVVSGWCHYQWWMVITGDKRIVHLTRSLWVIQERNFSLFQNLAKQNRVRRRKKKQKMKR